MAQSYRRALVWLRRDLRLTDHTALAEATKRAESAVVVFVYDTCILDALVDRDDRRVNFIQRSLDEVAGGLRSHGSDLVARRGDPVDVIPRLAEAWGAEAVFAAHDDDPYAQRRDAEVGARLAAQGRTLETCRDHVVFERREIVNPSGAPYQVYTPYMKAWRARFTPDRIAEQVPAYDRLAPRDALANLAPLGNMSLAEAGFQAADLWLAPGEAAGRERLEAFRSRIERYEADRDFPSLDATSGLSVHLRHGTVSVRECFRSAMPATSAGATKWTNELIWREFYHMILACFPHVVETTFRPEYADLEWPGTDAQFEAWRVGQTGYPLVDAAMRAFQATGWMHNRLRMVVASFLTKDLLVDWRRGEAEFARGLLDFELASNNGGWQWAASTGVDAQPYFRVFNPVLQSRKFDPEGRFIRTWCPELGEFEGDLVHWPHAAGPLERVAAGCVLGRDYPHPIVDHAVQRELAVRLLTRGDRVSSRT